MSDPCRRLFSALLGLGLFAGCGPSVESPDESNAERANRLAQETVLVDTHIDVPYRLTERFEDVGEATEYGNFDYPRARVGGLDIAFLSIYVPSSYQESGGAARLADELIDSVEAIVARHPDKFALAANIAEARRQIAAGRIVFALGIENGAAIEDDLAKLEHFYGRGVRYITLAHSKSNLISDSSYDEERRWQGLSEFGRRVVAEMNRLGIMIDVSHITDQAFEQVVDLSTVPVIASHSSCRRFTPGWERNMSDPMIRRLAAGGGVIQINFGSAFVDDRYRREWEAQRAEIDGYLEEHRIDPESEEAENYRESFRQQNSIEPADVADVADHIDHVVRLVGVDHVGIGSDFDGVGDSLPVGLEDVSRYPNLIRELLDRGYSESDVAKVLSGNLLRVWAEVEGAAARERTD